MELIILKQIQFLSFDTESVTNMKQMFQECIELEYIDLNKFNTSNVTNMAGMFNKCIKLKEIKGINNFNTKHSCRYDLNVSRM